MNPKIFVLAGPNGAGKTTGAARILPRRFPTEKFLNADNIAKALATDSPMEAGRIMLRRMHDLRDRRETFAFETTLAARSYMKFLCDAQEAGYLVHLAYVWLSTVELAKKRVAGVCNEEGMISPLSTLNGAIGEVLRTSGNTTDHWSTVGYYAIIQVVNL